MGLERLVVPIEWKAAGDDDQTLEGYASTFGNVDLGGDVVVKGAFRKTIANIKAHGIPLLADHVPMTSSVLGTIHDARETDKGLWIKAKFSSAPSAQDVRTKMLEGHVNKLSIGYEAMDHAFEDRDGQRVRLLKEVKLWETSGVVFPMNPEAAIASVKSVVDALQPTDRQKLMDEVFTDSTEPSVLLKVTANETREALQSALREHFKSSRQYAYLRDFDDAKIWYEVYGETADKGIFERGYEIDDQTTVTLAEAETQVRAVMTYVPMDGGKSTTLTFDHKTSPGDEPGGSGDEPEVKAAPPAAGEGDEPARPPDEGVKGWDRWASEALLAGRDPDEVTAPAKRAGLEMTLQLLEADFEQR